MPTDPALSFGPYRLDPGAARLWRGKQLVKVRSKTFAVLRSLVDRPGQLVTKDELFRAVWPETVVSEATLTSCIKELRQALRDDARTPRYIETAHGQGFRFIAPLSTTQPVQSSKSEPTPNTLHPLSWGERRSLRNCTTAWTKHYAASASSSSSPASRGLARRPW